MSRRIQRNHRDVWPTIVTKFQSLVFKRLSIRGIFVKENLSSQSPLLPLHCSNVSHHCCYRRRHRPPWFALALELTAITHLLMSLTLGLAITRAFLSPTFNPSQVKRVILLTREPSSGTAVELQAQGAEIYGGEISPNALEGVNAVVNALGFAVPKEVSDKLAEAAAAAGVKVYVPAEFGMCVDVLLIFSFASPGAKYSSDALTVGTRSH